ncbi:MAG: hypothetical protein ACE5GK_01305 [Nitrospiria bacterium]
MDTRKLFLMILVFVFASSFSLADAGNYPYLTQHDIDSHRSIASSVWTVMGGMVFLETEERTMRSFGLKEWEQEGFPPPEEGDEATLILDRGNTIVDITEPGGKGGLFGNEVRGVVQHVDGPMKQIAIETALGDMLVFEMKDAASTKLRWIQKGRTVSLAIDGQGRVMDAFRFE